MMMLSVARVKLITTNVIFSYCAKGISNQVSSNSGHEIKSYSCSNSSTKMGKNEKVGKNFLGLQNGAIRGLQNGTDFRDHKSGQKDYKSWQGCQIGAKRFLIGARRISNWSRDYKSVQNMDQFIPCCLVNRQCLC